MMSRDWLLVISSAALGGLLFFRPQSGAFLRDILTRSGPENMEDAEAQNAAIQTESLKAALASLEDLRSRLGMLPRIGVLAPVHARYPFNFKHELTVGAGRLRNVAAGDAVLVPAQESSAAAVFVGTVVKIFDDQAVVKTIFDPEFRLPVRIGPRGIDALLTGGAEPRLTLIAKSAPVVGGESVYAAGTDAPYGLAIGSLRELAPAKDQLFQEATVSFPYDPGDIRVVAVQVRP
jgi:cell shape-determining protein MreC